MSSWTKHGAEEEEEERGEEGKGGGVEEKEEEDEQEKGRGGGRKVKIHFEAHFQLGSTSCYRRCRRIGARE